MTEQIFRQTGGRVTEGPTQAGTRVQSQVTLMFDETTKYFLKCQLTPDQAQEMQDATGYHHANGFDEICGD